MAVARVYNVDTNLGTGISIGTGGAAGTEYVLMYGSSAGEFNVSAVRVGLYSLASASYPSNGSITFRLRPVSSTLSAVLAATGTAQSISQSATAATSVWIYSTSSGSGTGTFATMTQAPKWSQTIPCTAGANWAEWMTPGFEINTTNGTLALTYEMSNQGSLSLVNVVPELVISE